MAQDLPFELVESPETSKPGVPPKRSSGTLGIVDPIAFGHGLLRPFVRNGQGDWSNADDIRLVRANVGQALGTLASSGSTQGELQWRPEFGSVLQLIRHRNLDETTIELARTYVVDALKNWVFRIQVTDSKVEVDFKRSMLVITVTYAVLSTNRRSVISPNQTSSVAVPIAA